MLSFVYNIILN